MPHQDDPLTLVANGTRFTGWTEITLTRGVKQATSQLDMAVTNAWAGQDVVWPLPFTPVQLYLGRDLLLTGFIDTYTGELDAQRHGIRVTARSKTQDLIECMPDIASGQFNSYALDQIARGVCAPFGIDVVVDSQCDVGDPFPTAAMERCETAFRSIERLGRLRRVLLTDDPQGRLVLTSCGTARSSGLLAEGVNLLKLHGVMNGSHRFSEYILKGQKGLGGAGPGCDNWGSAGGIGTEGAPNQTHTRAQLQQRAVAFDAGVPRYRPHVKIGVGQLSLAELPGTRRLGSRRRPRQVHPAPRHGAGLAATRWPPLGR